MCGIAGVLSLDPTPVERAVRRMMRAMVHRGPDDEGYEQFPIGSSDSGGQCGFGFRRLSIMDLSPLGHQPMINRATGDCIASSNSNSPSGGKFGCNIANQAASAQFGRFYPAYRPCL